MKRMLLLIAAITQICYSQDVTIRHTYYTTVFSESKHIPVVVKWWLTKAMLDCPNPVPRTNNFQPDPQLPEYTDLDKDYKHSGYDRGHNMDALDNACDETGERESFYYSNMCPQTPKLNRGIWKSLETHCRNLSMEYDSLLIWCGSVATSGNTIGPDEVAVPDYCWKIVYIKRTGKTHAYSFRNDESQANPLSAYEVSLDSVQHLSGLKFELGR